MGTWERKKIKGKDSELPKKQVEEFFKDPFKFGGFPEGEHVRQVCKRTQEFINELVNNYSYENVLIATHGFAIRALLNFMYHDRADFWQGGVPYNCSVNILDYNNGFFNFFAKDKIYYDKSECIDRYDKKNYS